MTQQTTQAMQKSVVRKGGTKPIFQEVGVCPICRYELALYDSDYMTDEGTLFCQRCGYDHKREFLRDVEKSKQVYDKLRQLLKEREYDKAIKLADIQAVKSVKVKGTRTNKHLSRDELIAEVRNLCNRIKKCNFQYYLKTHSDGFAQYGEKESIGFGSYGIYDGKEHEILGAFTKTFGEKQFKDYVKASKNIDSFFYTKKIGGKWNFFEGFTGRHKEIGSQEYICEIRKELNSSG